MIETGTVLSSIAKALVLVLVVTAAGCDSKEDDPAKLVNGHISQARFFLSQGQLRAALIELKNAVKVDESNVEVHRLMGEAYLDGEAARPALLAFEKAIELGDTSAETRLNLARGHLLSGEPELAQSALALVTTDNARLSGERDLVLASVHLANGELEDARKIADSLVERALPQVNPAGNGPGVSELETFDEPVSQESRDSGWVTVLAGAYTVKAAVDIAGQRYSAAEKLLDEAVSADDGYAEAWLWKSRLASLKEDYSAAEKAGYKVLESAGRDVLTATAFEAQQTIISSKAQQGKFNEAYTSYKNFLDAYPTSAPAHFARAVRRLEDENLAGAESSVRRVLGRMPGHTPSQLMLGMITYAKGDLADAGDLFESIVEREGAGGAAQKLYAMTLIRRGRPKEAIALLEPAAEKAAGDGEILSLLGLAYAGAGNADAAAARSEAALEAEPGNAEILATAGESAALTGEIDVAVDRLNRALLINPGSERARYLLMQALLDNDRIEQAEKTVAEWLKSTPDSAAVQRAAAEVEFKKDNVDRGQEFLERAYNLSPRSLPVAYQLAELKSSRGQYEDAETIYRGIVNIDPDQLSAYRGLIATAVSAGRGDSILTYMLDEIDTNSRATAPRIALADYQLRNGDPNGALELAGEAMRIDSDSTEGQLIKGSAELALGNPNAARETFAALAAAEPDNWHAHFRLANTERIRGDAEAARVSAEQVLLLNPDYAPAVAIVAAADIAAGRFESAAERASWLKTRYPASPAGYELDGDLALRRENLTAAVAAYGAALKRAQSSDGRILVKKSEARARLGEGKAAIAEMSEWLDAHPGNLPVSVAIGVLMQQTGDADAAVGAYEKALAQGAEDTVLLNNLAWLYFEKEDPRAREIGQRAFERAPENPSVLDTYGWILVNQGDVAEGLPLLAKAVELAPDMPAIREHLDAARRMNDGSP